MNGMSNPISEKYMYVHQFKIKNLDFQLQKMKKINRPGMSQISLVKTAFFISIESLHFIICREDGIFFFIL